MEDDYWNLIVILPLEKIEVIDSRRESNNMERELHCLWNFLWQYCAFKNITILPRMAFCSRETISKEQNLNNNGIHVIFNMAAIIHHFPLNKINSRSCKNKGIHIVDFSLNSDQDKDYMKKEGYCLFLELKGEERR